MNVNDYCISVGHLGWHLAATVRHAVATTMHVAYRLMGHGNVFQTCR